MKGAVSIIMAVIPATATGSRMTALSFLGMKTMKMTIRNAQKRETVSMWPTTAIILTTDLMITI